MSRGGVVGAVSGAVVLFAIGMASLPTVEDAPATAPGRPRVALPDRRVRVEVVNWGGVPGMARDATSILREGGVDVVGIGNAPTWDAERPSVVFDRVGDPDAAQAVADVLGIDNVLSEPDPNLYVDVSVWLGREWAPPRGAGSGTNPRDGPWWSPRRWIER